MLAAELVADLAERVVGRAARRGPGNGPFPGSLPPTQRAPFDALSFPAIYAACATGFAWIQSWHGAQTMSVLRRIFAMSAAHAGWPGPGFPSVLRPVTWWTVTVVPVSQSSHSRVRSLLTSSLRG